MNSVPKYLKDYHLKKYKNYAKCLSSASFIYKFKEWLDGVYVTFFDFDNVLRFCFDQTYQN